MVIVSKNSMILKEALHRRRVKFQEEYSHDGRLRFDIAIFSGDGPNREIWSVSSNTMVSNIIRIRLCLMIQI